MNTNEKNRLSQIVSNLLVETQERIQKSLWQELVEITNEKLINTLFKNFSKLNIYQTENIVQETYLKFITEIITRSEKRQILFLDKEGKQVKNIFAYLYKIAKNKTILFLKKMDKVQFLDENQDAIVETEIISNDENKLLELEYRSKYLAISAIDPDSQREAFYTIIQFEFQEEKYTNDDVAKLIHAPSGNAVTQRKKEARKKYIQLLKNYQKRIQQTESFTLERIEKRIRQKIAKKTILDTSLETENTEELGALIWQIILLTKDKNFEIYCKFFLLDSVLEISNSELNKKNEIDFSELNYIFNHWTENQVTYESLINPKLKQS
jgi:DNA-directed RNA polymerase specialized sigma24 family protein